MRVVSLHRDVLVATSAIWQTNCVLVRGEDAHGQASGGGGEDGGEGGGAGGWGGGAEECFVIDAPVLPEELDALPALAAQAGFPAPSGLLATHGDWDHLLGRLAFPELELGCAQDTAARLRAAAGEAQRELRAFDKRHFIARPRPLALAAVQALPVPGRCALGDRELELHPAPGHTGEGMTIALDWAGVLVLGDYLSPVELPVLGPGGTAELYASTLERLRPLVQRATHVVPGHGRVLEREDALELLEEDLADVGEGRASSSTRLRRSSRSARPRRSPPPR